MQVIVLRRIDCKNYFQHAALNDGTDPVLPVATFNVVLRRVPNRATT